jgi:hypothetical protein
VEELLLSLNINGVSDIRHMEIHTCEPLVPESSPFEVKNAIAKMKKYKLSGTDQTSAESIKAGGETLRP